MVAHQTNNEQCAQLRKGFWVSYPVFSDLAGGCDKVTDSNVYSSTSFWKL